MMRYEDLPFWDEDGNEVNSYEDSWNCQVLERVTNFAHLLMSRKLSDLSGYREDGTYFGVATTILTPDYDPLVRVVMFTEEERIERVIICHAEYDSPVVEIPPPVAFIVTDGE